ncbi:MAG TPA: sugar phosphate isomerase/epimerase family protein [Pirellulales bacterium]|nr:sugar phosphate isomerase/epimerase family protein [Pirellulales bacterium]
MSLGAVACGGISGGSNRASAFGPIARPGGPRIKLALNAYSFSKRLNDSAKGRDSDAKGRDSDTKGQDSDRHSAVTLLSLLDFCARQGFDGFDPTGYFFPGYPQAPPNEYVNRLKRRAFDLGIGISGTGVRNNFTTADKAVRSAAVEHIRQWVEVAARLGAPVLRVFADTQMKDQTWQTVSRGSPRAEVEGWIADDLRRCAEHGEKFGVIIGVQNHGDFLRTSDEHLSLIRRIDSPWCGPIVDTGYYRSDDPYQDIAAVAPYAVNWQVKESPVGAGSEVRTDLKRLLSIVRMSGYRGYLPIETLSARGAEYDPFDVVPKFLARLREALDATASIAPEPLAEEPAGSAKAPAGEAIPGNPAAANPTGGNAATSQPSSRPARKPPNRDKRNPPANR